MLWKVKALWLVWQGSLWPPALLQMLAGMRLLSFATSFSSPLWGWAESVHTASSFIPLAQVCVAVCVCTPGCCTFQLSHSLPIGFLVWWKWMILFLFLQVHGISAKVFPWEFMLLYHGTLSQEGFRQPSVPVPCWRSCCPCSGRQEGSASC